MNKSSILFGVLCIIISVSASPTFVMNYTGACMNSPSSDSSDLALGKAVTYASNLTDNDYTSGRVILVPAGGSGYSEVIDLGQVYTNVNYYNINWGTPSGGSVDTKILETSIDNSSWTSVSAALANAAPNNNSGYFYPRSVRYLRIRGQDNAAPTVNGNFTLYEVKVYQKAETCTFYSPRLLYVNGKYAKAFWQNSSTNNFNSGIWLVTDALSEDITYLPDITYTDGSSRINAYNPAVPTGGITPDYPFGMIATAYNNNIYFVWARAGAGGSYSPLASGVTGRLSRVSLATGTVTNVGEFAIHATTNFNSYVAFGMATNDNTTDLTSSTTTLRFFVFADLVASALSSSGFIWANGTTSTATNSTADTRRSYVTGAGMGIKYNNVIGTNADNFTVLAENGAKTQINKLIINGAGQTLSITSLKSSANQNDNGRIYANNTKFVYYSTDTGSGDPYNSYLNGSSSAVLLPDDAVSERPLSLLEVQNNNVYVLYLNNTNVAYYRDYFCGTSLTASLGSSCACPSNYYFDGYQCTFFGGTDTSNQTYDRVTLTVKDKCKMNYFIAYNIPNCNTGLDELDTVNRDYVQTEFLINGQDAYDLTNGTAYCKVVYASTDIGMVRANWTNEGGALHSGWQVDVATDLARNNSAICPDQNTLAFPISAYCLRGQTVRVQCFANNAKYGTLDDIEVPFNVRGYGQYFSYWTVQNGVQGSYSSNIPSTANSVDTKLSYTVSPIKAGDLKCVYSPYAIFISNSGQFVDMTPSTNGIFSTWSYTETGRSKSIGDNRYTIYCAQYNQNDPVQVRIEYDKYNVFNVCNVTSSKFGKLTSPYFMLLNGTAVNYSKNNTQLTNKYTPKFQISYLSLDGNSFQTIDPSVSCSYKVLDNNSGLQITDGNLVPDQQNLYYTAELKSSLADQWPTVGGIANYTIQITCSSNECRTIPKYNVDFSMYDNPCSGDAYSCYPNNITDASYGCFSCATQPYNFTCDDGYILTSFENICVIDHCSPPISGQTRCLESGHSKYYIQGFLNNKYPSAVSPGLELDMKIMKRGASEVNPTAEGLSAVCNTFLYPNGAPNLQGCTPFVMAGIAGFNQQYCGYQYQMVWDASKNAFVWNSDKDLSLAFNQQYGLETACVITDANRSSTYLGDNSFITSGEGKCANSLVNVSDGEYTNAGQCFKDAPPWLCRLDATNQIESVPAQCGCPKGMAVNGTICSGDRTYDASDLKAQISWGNMIGLIILAPFIFAGLMLIAHFYRSRQIGKGSQ